MIAGLALALLLAPPSVSGSAHLSWIAPTTRADGSALPRTEIAGYKVYRGATNRALSLIRTINDRERLWYVDTELRVGTYYYAVTVYNIYGAESAYSQVVSKEITAKWPGAAVIYLTPG